MNLNRPGTVIAPGYLTTLQMFCELLEEPISSYAQCNEEMGLFLLIFGKRIFNENKTLLLSFRDLNILSSLGERKC